MMNATEIVVASILGGSSLRMNGSDLEQRSYVYLPQGGLESIITNRYLYHLHMYPRFPFEHDLGHLSKGTLSL